MEIKWKTQKMMQSGGLDVQDFIFETTDGTLPVIVEHFIGINGFYFRSNNPNYGREISDLGIVIDVISQPAPNIVTVSCKQILRSGDNDVLRADQSWVWVTVVVAVSTADIDSLNFRNVFNMTTNNPKTEHLGKNVVESLSCLRSFSSSFSENKSKPVSQLKAKSTSENNGNSNITVRMSFELKSNNDTATCNQLNTSAVSSFDEESGFIMRSVEINSKSGEKAATGNESSVVDFDSAIQEGDAIALISDFNLDLNGSKSNGLISIVAGNMFYSENSFGEPKNAIKIENNNNGSKVTLFSNASMHSHYAYASGFGSTTTTRHLEVYSEFNTVRYLVFAKDKPKKS